MPDRIEIALLLRDAMTADDFADRIRGDSALADLRAQLGPVCHDELETAMVSGGTGLRNEYRGLEAFVSAWRDWVQPFESFRIVIGHEMEATEDAILGLAQQTGVLSGGGEVSSDAAAVMFFRDGLLARVEFHMDRAEARRAAGLKS